MPKHSARRVMTTLIVTTSALSLQAPTADAATLRSAALSTANSQKGARYVSGAEGGYSRGYDCSGLVWYAYKQHGKTLPRTAQAQYNALPHVSASSRQPGDLIFIGRSSGSIYHAGVFTGVKSGKGWMTNANSGSYRGRKVVEAPVTEYTSGSPRAYYARVGG